MKHPIPEDTYDLAIAFLHMHEMQDTRGAKQLLAAAEAGEITEYEFADAICDLILAPHKVPERLQ